MKRLKVYTDGSCNNRKGKEDSGIGGCSFVLKKDDEVISKGFSGEETTSNRMELLAAIKAIQFCKDKFPKEKITIFSDSAYVVNCFSNRWYEGWEERRWLGVKNEDLWRTLIDLKLKNKVKFRKVKGHSGMEMNELADKIAGEARLFLLEKIKDERN